MTHPPLIAPLSRLLAEDRAADALVAWHEDRAVNWKDFRHDVGSMSEALRARTEQEWLLACATAYEFAVALLAIWHAGRRAVVPPSLQPDAVAAARAYADGMIESLDGWRLERDVAADRLLPFDPALTFVDLYTSGSTGSPKRITKSVCQLEAEIAVLEGCWGGPVEPVFATVPHHHIYGLLFRVLWPLSAGRPFDGTTCTAPEFLLSRLEARGPGRVVSSPSQLGRMPELIDLRRLDGHATRIFSSGGPLDGAAATQFVKDLGAAPVEILGSTETGGIAWRMQQRNDSAWTPMPGVTVNCADSGALTLRSPFLPDDLPYETSDAATLLPDGRFELRGRLDRIVKIEEKRLSLHELEQRLASHAWVREAATVVLPGRRQILGAAVVLTEGGRLQLDRGGRAALAQGLREYLAGWFDPVLLPRRWRYPASLPYNERGKLAVDALRSLFDPTDTQHG